MTQTPLPVILARLAWYGYSGKGALTAIAWAAGNDNGVGVEELAASDCTAGAVRFARVFFWTGQTTHPPEEPVTPAMPVQKKTRAKRTAPAVQSEAASSSTPTPLSLPAAQAMAVSAPLPEYPYQAKRANITGSGVCVITIDTASGKVTDAMMAQSTGDAMLDKVTTNTFRRWRFKPGTMSQVRVPVDYE